MNGTKSIIVSLSAIGLALLLAAPVRAQAPAGGGGGQRRGGGAVSLATLPVAAIDSIVTLDADQKTKIGAIQATYKTDAAAAQGDQAKMREVRTKATDDIKAVLKADQSTKLTETMPSLTLLARSRAVPIVVLADVKLTADQWTKIKAAAKDEADKLAAIDQADRRAKAPELVAAFKTTVEALLTDDQKKVIEKAPKPAAPGAPAAGAAAGNN